MIPLTDPTLLHVLQALRLGTATLPQQQEAAVYLQYLTTRLEAAHKILRMAEQMNVKLQTHPGNS